MTTARQMFKQRIRLFSVVIGLSLALGVAFPQSLFAQTGGTTPQEPAVLAISQPDGVGDVVAEGKEYSIDLLGDAWDMSPAPRHL